MSKIQKGKIAIIDDEKIIRMAYKRDLQRRGYCTETYDSAIKFLPDISRDWPGVLVSDIVMPGMDGFDLVEKVGEVDPDLPVILITGHGDIPTAVKAIKKGAYDFLVKPFSTESLIEVIDRAMEKRRLVMEVRQLRSEINRTSDLSAIIIGRSDSAEQLRRIVQTIAATDSNTLLLGETGTGKDLVARCLHDLSQRNKSRFVAINCGAIPETIIESELFGHEKGAFTGASKRRIGKFEYANGGTIFLDEIESMPLQLQVKLLRVLQERTVERLGANESIPIDVRVIAAAKIDLKKACDEGRFRQDLYYRLNVAPIHIPPLRQRTEDIPLLFQHFVLQACSRYGQTSPPPLSMDLMQKFLSMNWEGNIRELKNEAEKCVLGINNFSYDSAAGQAYSQAGPIKGKPETLSERIMVFEKEMIEQELARQHGNIQKTQKVLGIPRQTLYYKIKKFGLKRKNYI